MPAIAKLWRLTRADRSLLLKTVLWLGGTTLALWLLPLKAVRRVLAVGLPAGPGRTAPSRERIVWAVSVAGRFFPYASCLPQALVTQALFTQSGYPAALRIGVDKLGAGRLTAHAWVESEGRIVVGNLEDLSRYAPLPPLPRT